MVCGCVVALVWQEWRSVGLRWCGGRRLGWRRRRVGGCRLAIIGAALILILLKLKLKLKLKLQLASAAAGAGAGAGDGSEVARQ